MAYALQLPADASLMQAVDVVHVEKLVAARRRVKRALAQQLMAEFEAVYALTSSAETEYKFTPAEVARRRLRNTCLDFLTSLGTESALQRASAQYTTATCMTERIAALGCLSSHPGALRDAAVAHFHKFAEGDSLVLNKWFAVQAGADLPDLLTRVKELQQHPDFLISNPNRARSLLSTFAANLPHFHAADGSGYVFTADNIIVIDSLNPQVAARMALAFSQWTRFDDARQALMRAQLERIRATTGLSKDTLEVVSRCLK